MMTVLTEEVMIRGTKLRVLKKGSGSPLIYLHGYNYDIEWHDVLEELSKNYTVYRIDHPGFNYSDENDGIDTVQDLAFFYLDIIEKLQLKDITLMGSSLGGWLAMEIGVIAPDKIAKLILIDAYGIRAEGVKLPNLFRMSQKTIVSNLFLDNSLQDEILKKYTSTPEFEKIVLNNNVTTAHFGWNPYMHNPKLLQLMHRLTMPVLLIWGKEDKLLPVAYAEKLHELLPHSILKIISDAAHLPHIERPNEFIKNLENFLG